MTVTTRDLGIGKLRKQLEDLKRCKILVGVQGEDATKIHPVAKVPQGLLAFWLHYGTKRNGEPYMPPRPYVERAIAMLAKRSFPVMKKAIADLVDGRAKDLGAALAPLGEMAVEQVNHEIDTATEWAAPLAPSTVAAKGHDRPLVDTGAIRGATSYTVRLDESIIAEGRGRNG